MSSSLPSSVSVSVSVSAAVCRCFFGTANSLCSFLTALTLTRAAVPCFSWEQELFSKFVEDLQLIVDLFATFVDMPNLPKDDLARANREIDAMKSARSSILTELQSRPLNRKLETHSGKVFKEASDDEKGEAVERRESEKGRKYKKI